MANVDTRHRIMRAAKELVSENAQVAGVTLSLESVATRAELTKPGLMYHFSTKEALMVGLVEFAARQWDERLRAHSGAGPGELSVFERYRAYVEVATTADVSRADYWIFSDALYHRVLASSWQSSFEPWFSLDDEPAHVRAALTAARFCADGAWMSEATGVFPAEDVAPVRDHALHLIDEAEQG